MSWHETAVTDRLGIEYPIVQGPFGGGLSSTLLASTVSNAGGLGSYGADWMEADQIRTLVTGMRSLTSKPFAVNLWIPTGTEPHPSAEEFDRVVSLFAPYYAELGLDAPDRPGAYGQRFEDQVEALLDARPPVFSFVYGIPEPNILSECRARGITTLGTATTVQEAIALEKAGVDCIVASGFEAGGHKGAFLKPVDRSLVGTFALIPQIADRIQTPLIAAGGIADGRGIRAAFALGAQGVQIGTAFLACEESGASGSHRHLLFSDARGETVLTTAFTGRLARSIPNLLSDGMAPHAAALPPYPIQSWFAGRMKAAARAQARPDLASLWCGQAAPLVQHRAAAALFAALVHDAGQTPHWSNRP